ncbi:MAG: DHA2 family efflux MFS transporter permease subunit [Alphaproteobacteria bacterium]|nr:DHA2 family efflux MFS transporter permease subunit [Alphaproteobacteria bacterium]
MVGATMGAFLAVLNIQIVNSSLADIQGAIGAGIDEGGWVTTSYLVTEIIVIPLTGWLAAVFSVRRYLLVNTVLFLAFSVACAFAQDLSQMIVLRGLQGFAGGVLIPMAFTIIITMLPPANRPIGIALFAVAATFAPAIGPTIGGYLNDNYGWEFIFYVNLVPGIAMLAMLWYALPPAPMRLDLLKHGDWVGIATLAIGLGALQTVLEEGNKDDWFGSPFILRLSIVAGVALLAFVWIELSVKKPVIDLRLLRRRNFGLGTFAAFLLGVALYGSSFLLPLYLSQMQGYNSQQIGEVLAWTGIPQLAIIPLVPLLMKRIDACILVGVGFALFAASNFMNVALSADVARDQLFWPNIVRALGQAVLLTPLTAIATAEVAAADAGSASGLYNMTRNLGGAIGIAALQTILTKREQLHSTVITARVSEFEPATRLRIGQLQQYFLAHGVSDPAAAWHQAVAAIGRTVRMQSYLLAYADAFFILGAALVMAFATVLLFKRAGGAGAAGAH